MYFWYLIIRRVAQLSWKLFLQMVRTLKKHQQHRRIPFMEVLSYFMSHVATMWASIDTMVEFAYDIGFRLALTQSIAFSRKIDKIQYGYDRNGFVFWPGNSAERVDIDVIDLLLIVVGNVMEGKVDLSILQSWVDELRAEPRRLTTHDSAGRLHYVTA